MIRRVLFLAVPLLLLAAQARAEPPTRARANLAELVSDQDYPAEAIRNGEQGTTGFRLQVGPDGLVRECLITQSSGSAALDATTCRIFQARARFAPARDKRGRPTSDAVDSRLKWVLPEPGPAFQIASPERAGSANLARLIASEDYPEAAKAAREEGSVGFVVTLTPAGRVESCRVWKSSGSVSLDEATCRIVSERASYAPVATEWTETAVGTITWRLPQ